jgi:hypothetical protein
MRYCVCPLRTGISGLKDDSEQRRTEKLCFSVRLGGNKPSVFEGMGGGVFTCSCNEHVCVNVYLTAYSKLNTKF